MQGINMVFYF